MVFDSLRDDIEKDAYVDYFGAGSLMDSAFFLLHLPKTQNAGC
jgi:hypothetical protein